MKQSDFLDKLKKYINKTSRRRDPEITANAIYFMIKQYPGIRRNRRDYLKVLQGVKIHLITNSNWTLVEVHNCFCYLNRLLKHS